MTETELGQFREVEATGRFTRQNASLLKVRPGDDEIRARLGAMVAYRGGVRFEYKGGGVGRFLKKATSYCTAPGRWPWPRMATRAAGHSTRRLPTRRPPLRGAVRWRGDRAGLRWFHGSRHALGGAAG
jgi:hypothetical protein